MAYQLLPATVQPSLRWPSTEVAMNWTESRLGRSSAASAETSVAGLCNFSAARSMGVWKKMDLPAAFSWTSSTCTDMCIGMCMDMCTGMCMDMCTDRCIGMCIDMRIGMCRTGVQTGV